MASIDASLFTRDCIRLDYCFEAAINSVLPVVDSLIRNEEAFSIIRAINILEYIDDPVAAIRNWWKAIVSGGRLIVVVPHRDKPDCSDKWLWLPNRSDPPRTKNLTAVLAEAIPSWSSCRIIVRRKNRKDKSVNSSIARCFIKAIVEKKQSTTPD